MPAQNYGDLFNWEDNGRATYDGHDIAELAAKYPTPFYLISQRQLKENYRKLRQAFSSVEGLETYYSVKSNFESIVLRSMAEEGCGAEISGALDMELARRAGMKPENVVFDGPVKPVAPPHGRFAAGMARALCRNKIHRHESVGGEVQLAVARLIMPLVDSASDHKSLNSWRSVSRACS